MKRWVRVCAVLFGGMAMALAVAACGGSESSEGEGGTAGQELSQEPIRVFVGIDTAYSPFFVAERQGYFEDEGINADLTQFTQGGEGVDALIAGQMDAGGSGDATVLGKSVHGNIKALAVLQTSGDILKLVVRQEITDVEQIKTIGIVPGSLSEYAAAQLLKHFDIPESSIKFVSAGPPEMPPLLQKGDIDAYVLWEPWPTKGEELGGKILMHTKDFGYSYLFMLVVNEDWFADHEAEAAAYVRAMAKGADTVEEDPQLAAEDTKAEVKIPIELSLQVIDEALFKVRPFTDADITYLEEVADFLVQRKITETRPDPKELIVEGFAEKALAGEI
ncbi:MAG: ABC transporter substrate-binding protein [Gaiella sp.]|nr:ABC transporter substrate-binding protein [Gaiella sp.]